jgi:filamentous hemagglutinin family protein
MKLINKTKFRIQEWDSNSLIFKVTLLYFLSFSTPTTAQIVPDTSLIDESRVLNQGNTSIINGGTKAGNNLFHSFKQFSLPTDGTAYFNNTLDIQNIFSRVTGKSPSEINGLIRANGTANLFLINPNGIIFSPNASLNVGGSFVASTANSINFANNYQFSATDPQGIPPLLTLNVPIGLQYGVNSGAIQVRGTGHNLTIPTPLFSPILGAGASLDGLHLSPGKTLALIGGDVSLTGGILTAPGGRIELGAVKSGIVNLIPSLTGWTLDYKYVQDFQDIKLSQQALVDASGLSGGSIQLASKQISLTNGSLGLIQNQRVQSGGSINVNALESLELSGTSLDGKIGSGFLNETVAGNVGDIVVSTKNLTIQDGAVINAKTFTEANSGNIILNASESTQIIGFSSINPTSASGIGNYTFSSGKGGKIIINTGEVTAFNGGTIISGTFGNGKSGNLIVNASQGIKLSGFNPFIVIGASQLAVATFSAGDAGNLTINTPKVFLQNGGSINSYAFAIGNAGSIKINAYNSVDITREGSNGLNYELPFGISSYATPSSDTTQQELLNVPITPNGTSGDVTINTSRLNVRDGGVINVSNLGNGNAGILRINANAIFLDNSGSIVAATVSGEGGDLFINSSFLGLRRGSNINVTAGGSGNGGNIDINTIFLTASKNSSITANAFEGRGGNIRINTRGLFFSTDSIITASSQLGVDGTVEVNDFYTNPADIKAAPEIVPETPKMASGCAAQSAQSGLVKSILTLRGSNSPPPESDEQLYSQPFLGSDSVSVEPDKLPHESQSSITKETAKIVEAEGWITDSKGNVELVATIPNQPPQNSFLATSPCSSVGSATKVFPSVKVQQSSD